MAYFFSFTSRFSGWRVSVETRIDCGVCKYRVFLQIFSVSDKSVFLYKTFCKTQDLCTF
jgi:hypothetical protein